MPKDVKPGTPVVTVGVESLGGELFQLVLCTIQGDRVVSTERPHPPHVWGHVRFEFEQAMLESVFPAGHE